MLKEVVIFSKDNDSKTDDSVKTLVHELSNRGIGYFFHKHEGMMPESFRLCAGGSIFTDFAELPRKPDMIFSIGGDGTFLETARIVREYDIPIAGINTGRLGFLANIPNDCIGNSIELLCNDHYTLINRSMLELKQPSTLYGMDSPVALNEITVQKKTLNMITIHVFVNEVFLNTYWADGVIVSTATGSTAYSMSVGGPILSPDDQSIIISPMSAHNLTVRPIVLAGKNELRLVVDGRADEYLVTCDFKYTNMKMKEEIRISNSDILLKTVMLDGFDFYSTLRNKLMWGIDKRN